MLDGQMVASALWDADQRQFRVVSCRGGSCHPDLSGALALQQVTLTTDSKLECTSAPCAACQPVFDAVREIRWLSSLERYFAVGTTKGGDLFAALVGDENSPPSVAVVEGMKPASKDAVRATISEQRLFAVVSCGAKFAVIDYNAD